ncbi:hypothetical protein E2C01_018350 [Portunus trituberculatus]|uniref:Uncharacterized protein n=1 Tax=Portunus trituberculatus TaxID=210409 RepID=A0A5B7DVA2_PORTR|nr:hypothetical protein [Portunus trituberculatus]
MQNEAIAGAEFPGAGQAATTSAPPQDTSAEIYSGGYSLCSKEGEGGRPATRWILLYEQPPSEGRAA